MFDIIPSYEQVRYTIPELIRADKKFDEKARKLIDNIIAAETPNVPDDDMVIFVIQLASDDYDDKIFAFKFGKIVLNLAIKVLCRIPINLCQLKIQHDLYATHFVNLVADGNHRLFAGGCDPGRTCGVNLKVISYQAV